MADEASTQNMTAHTHHMKSQSCSAGCETGVSTSAPNISASVTEAQSTVSIQLQGPIDPYRFNMFMADLLAERGSDIKRMYGVLTVQGYGNRGTCFKFEGSQNMVTFGPTTGMASDSSSEPASLVTFAGHNLSEQDLREALETCTWLPPKSGWTEHYASGVQQPFYVHQATGRKQWQRPAALEPHFLSAQVSQIASASQPSTIMPSASLTPDLHLPGPSPPHRPESTDATQRLEEGPIRTSAAVRRRRAGARAAVSCPCNASDACAAAFDIKHRKDRLQAKRLRESSSDVTSKLAELDLVDVSQLVGSDSENPLEEARMGYGRRQRKLSPVKAFVAEMHALRERRPRSNSCQLSAEQSWSLCRQQMELSH